jgi:single-stranded-DNA-specific exonuclease
MNSFLKKLLDYYAITEEAYSQLGKAPSFASLPDISSSLEVQKALKSLQEVKEKKERILIYGDYDCDGISSSSILLRAFKEYGLDAEAYLPSRYLDGYGLTTGNVEKAHRAGYSAIFTCDNGVSASEAVALALKEGIKVLVLDHHEYKEPLPGLTALIHPKTVNLLNPEVSAGFLSYLFARVLLKKDDEYLVCLAGMSTLSDAMPLQKYNRDVVRLALNELNTNHYEEFSLLTNKTHFDETLLAMDIIPKINAIGRLEQGTSINRLLIYFAGNDKNKKPLIANWMNEVNTRRKALTKEAESSLSLDPNEEAILVTTSLPEGLNGLLASRLLNEYGKPVAVFSPDSKNPGVLVGSLRSKEGFNILKALEGCKAPLLAGGGHAFAGGVSILESDLPLFKKDFIYAAIKHKLMPNHKKNIPLDISEATMENYELLRSFAPFGEGNEHPSFVLSSPIDQLAFSLDGKYLSTRISSSVRLFSFSLGTKDFPKEGTANLSLHMAINEWKGRLSLDLLVDELLP